MLDLKLKVLNEYLFHKINLQESLTKSNKRACAKVEKKIVHPSFSTLLSMFQFKREIVISM